MNVLFVLTSHDRLGNTGEKTGFWLEEFAAPYYRILDAGHDVVLASPKGGQPPLDPKSELADFQTDDTRRFANDPQAQAALSSTIKLSDVQASQYDAIFYPGGHGPLWDLINDKHSIELIESFLSADKPVAAVCHAPAVLINVQVHGQPLLKDKHVTAFSNSEEAAVGLTDVVPFLLETSLQTLGAHYQKGDDWAPFVCVDGKLITGQNPASSAATAQALVQQLA